MLKKLGKVIVYFYNRFFDDQCSIRASALAYSSLLTIVPLLISIFWILSFFPFFSNVGHDIQKYILTNFVADSAGVISKQIDIFMKQVKLISWTGVVGFLFASIIMMYNLVEAFNAIWKVSMKRHFAIEFFIYFLVLVISPIIFGLLILLSSYIASLPLIPSAGTFMGKPFLRVLSYLSSWATFTLFNWAIPSRRVHFRNALIAGFITAVFFEIGKYLFALYLFYFPTYRLIYGALSTIPIFLIWMYVTWSIILLGAIICHTLETRAKSP